MVGFAADPEEHAFEDFDCDTTLSDDSIQVISRLSAVFAIPVKSLKDTVVIEPFKEHRAFYTQLASILQSKPSPDPPVKRNTRSNDRHNSSSPFYDEKNPTLPTDPPFDFGSPSSSPEAAGAKRKIRLPHTTPIPNKFAATSASPGDVLTKLLPADGPLEGDLADSSTMAILPPVQELSQVRNASEDDRTSNTSHKNQGASPSDGSEFYTQSSSSVPVNSGSESDGDVLEDEVNDMFKLFIGTICTEHGDSDGYSFTIKNSFNLKLVIDGEVINTRPDRTVYVNLNGGQDIAIFDYEVRGIVLIRSYQNNGNRENEILGWKDLLRGSANCLDEVGR